MRFFVAYKYTGEDPEELKRNMRVICDSLKSSENDFYCTLWEDESFQNKTKIEMMKHAFDEIDNSDGLFVFVNSDEKSEGMLMEVGYCLAKDKKIILAVHENVTNTYLRNIANKIIEFSDIENLKAKMVKEVKEE